MSKLRPIDKDITVERIVPFPVQPTPLNVFRLPSELLIELNAEKIHSRVLSSRLLTAEKDLARRGRSDKFLVFLIVMLMLAMLTEATVNHSHWWMR